MAADQNCLNLDADLHLRHVGTVLTRLPMGTPTLSCQLRVQGMHGPGAAASQQLLPGTA